MSSDQFTVLEEIGIQRGGGAEPCHGPPESFTIIGLDIAPEKLIARYPETKGKLGEAHERARKLIRGVRDRTRADANDPPPEHFISAIGSAGIAQRIIVANLGKDAKGKPWCIIVAGRQRDHAARIWNKAHPTESVVMLAELRGFRNTDKIDAELSALDLNSASNVFVPMRPSQMADHALMHHEAGRSPASIAAKVGVRDVADVPLLLLLAKCHESVGRAVDAGRVALADVAALAKCDHAEQARRVARRLAGNSRAARNAAAPPRAKTRPARELAALCDRIRETMPRGKDDVDEALRLQREAFLAGITYSAGGDAPEWLEAIEEAEAAQ